MLHQALRVAALLLIPLAAHLPVHAEWFTLAGVAGDNNADYIQTDPTSVAGSGALRSVSVRVSRTAERTSTDGVRFRSFESVAEVDCNARQARYTRATFFARPHFEGPPITTLTYPRDQQRPMAFRQIGDEFATKLIRATCGANYSSSETRPQ